MPSFQEPMLKLTKKADYALMAMKHLAEHAHDDLAGTSLRFRPVIDGAEWLLESFQDDGSHNSLHHGA